MPNRIKSVPLDASHDYVRQFNKDERYYHRLNDEFLQVHECTFPIERLAGSTIDIGEFNICDDAVTFKIPFTKGAAWHRGSVNQRYKDQDLPRYETRAFPLWQKQWTQYKLDPLHVTCDDFSSYKMALDKNTMRELNDNLLNELMGIIGSYNADFCECGAQFKSYTETQPLHVVEGTNTLTDFVFNNGSAFQSECLPDRNYMMLLPRCMKNFWLRDKAIKDAYSQCCQALPPHLSGMVPDMYQSVNGVTVVFLNDAWFDQIEVEPGVIAYKIPTFSVDAIAYKAARLDYTEIGPDKEEDGNHYRWAFYYSMFVGLPEGIRNDWVVFEPAALPIYTVPA